MEKELENDNSEIVEEEETPEVETQEETPEEEPEQESELEAKNRQLFERAKKAENELKELKAELQEKESDNYYEEDDDATRKQIKALSEKLELIEEEKRLNSAIAMYPILKDKLPEFDEYREANPGMSTEIAAKAFLVEHDLLGQAPKRKGLEKAGGGQRTPPSNKMSTEDVKRLRENNFKEYKRLLMEGKIQV